MKVEIEEVYYIARLARLELKENEAKRVSEKLSILLEYMSRLETLDNESNTLSEDFKNSKNVFRNDITHDRISHNEALSQSPDPENNYFRVPKVIS